MLVACLFASFRAYADPAAPVKLVEAPGELKSQGATVTDKIVFSGVGAGKYHPDKIFNWNPYKFEIIKGGDRSVDGKKNNIYASSILRGPGNSTQIFYGGWDFKYHSTTTDMVFFAQSDNFLSRADQNDISPPMFAYYGVTLGGDPKSDSKWSGWAINDPSASIINWDGKADRTYVFFSAARPTRPEGTQAWIGWAITSLPLEMKTWFPHSGFWACSDPKACGGARPVEDNKIRIRDQSGSEVTFAHRPSLVAVPAGTEGQIMYYLYYDQAGLYGSPIFDAGPSREVMPTIKDRIEACCSNPANIPCVKNQNGTAKLFAVDPNHPESSYLEGRADPDYGIVVATSRDGKNFKIRNKRVLPLAVSAEAKRFQDGWVLFADEWPDERVRCNFSSEKNRKEPADCSRQQILPRVSSDGINYKPAARPIWKTKEFVLPTNISAVTDYSKESLKGILYGEFTPQKNDACFPAYRLSNFGDVCIEQGKLKALFLQKRVLFESDDGKCDLHDALALDEDRVEFELPVSCRQDKIPGRLTVFDTDGITVLFREKVSVKRGVRYNISQ